MLLKKEGYSLPEGANTAEYRERGWVSRSELEPGSSAAACSVGGERAVRARLPPQCFCESSWAMLTKDFDFVNSRQGSISPRVWLDNLKSS